MFLIRTHKYHEALEQIRELKREIKDMKSAYDLKEQKAVHALEAKLDKELTAMARKNTDLVAGLKTKHAEELANIRVTSSEQHYGKLSDSMTKLHEQGNATTKFMEKMVVSMTDAYGLKQGNVQNENIKITHKQE